MKIKIITFGKIKENSLKEMINLFSKRISHFCDLEIIELNEAKIDNENNSSDISIALKKEAEMLLKYVKNCPFNIVLDINGKHLDSLEFADLIDKNIKSLKQINFIIGSSYGIDDSIKQLCQYKLSFSKMTFNHQIFRLMLVEQIYRAFTIKNNIKYHK